jgi:hypothetical protein
MSQRRRVARLEWLLPPRPPPSPEALERTKRWQQITRRLFGILERTLPLLSEEQQKQVIEGFEDIDGAKHGPYSAWLDHLLHGRCRLPELAPEACKDLLLAWPSPEVDGGMVCRHCGLEYPKHRHPPLREWKVLPGKTPLEGPPPWYDLPEFFASCPHCGASRFEIDWPHRVREFDRPWMKMDGCVGMVQ